MAEEKKRIGFELGMGWLPDYPEFRDYTVDKKEVSTRLMRLGQKDSVRTMLTKAGIRLISKAMKVGMFFGRGKWWGKSMRI